MNDSLSNSHPVSSSAPTSFPPFFRRRTLGRAPSPPTWACYEQIPPPASDSDECDTDVQTDSDTQSGSDSEAEGEYVHERHLRSDSPGGMEMEMQVGEPEPVALSGTGMELDGTGGSDRGQDKPGAENACGSAGEQCNDDDCDQQLKRQDKGKQRAVEPELETLPVEKSPKKRHRKRRHHETSFMYRPILTIKKSEGFVWNQVRQICCSSSRALTEIVLIFRTSSFHHISKTAVCIACLTLFLSCLICETFRYCIHVPSLLWIHKQCADINVRPCERAP